MIPNKKTQSQWVVAIASVGNGNAIGQNNVCKLWWLMQAILLIAIGRENEATRSRYSSNWS